jgi:hypothetical protein
VKSCVCYTENSLPQEYQEERTDSLTIYIYPRIGTVLSCHLTYMATTLQNVFSLVKRNGFRLRPLQQLVLAAHFAGQAINQACRHTALQLVVHEAHSAIADVP